jgi:hypothetical protein
MVRTGGRRRRRARIRTGEIMSSGFIVLVLLILLAIGAMPRWGYSRSWGHYPSGLLGLLVIVVLILLLTHQMSW